MDLFDYWNETCPPTNELVAAFVGFESGERKSEPSDFEQQYLANVPVKKFGTLPSFIQRRLGK